MGAIFRKYATATAAGSHIRVQIVDAGNNNFAVSADWTPAAGDVKLSKDGGAQANIATLPTFTNGSWQFQLTAAELTCKTLEIVVVDSPTKAVEDQFILIETYGNASALHPFDLSVATQNVNVTQISGDAAAADNAEAFFDGTGYASAGTVGITNAGADLILDRAITEPAAVFAWPATLRNIAGWLGALASNRVTQTATTTTVRNRADSVTIGTRTTSDDGVTFVSGSAT